MNCVTHFKNNLVLFKRKLSFKGFVSKGEGAGQKSNQNYCSSGLKFLYLDVGFEYTDFFSIPVNNGYILVFVLECTK